MCQSSIFEVLPKSAMRRPYAAVLISLLSLTIWTVPEGHLVVCKFLPAHLSLVFIGSTLPPFPSCLNFVFFFFDC